MAAGVGRAGEAVGPRDGSGEVAPVVELRGVVFSYRQLPVLRDVSLEVRPGELVALVGANGAGKSTVVRLALGELAPEAGEVRLFGTPVPSFAGWREVGYVPQRVGAAYDRFPATVAEVVCANVARRVPDGSATVAVDSLLATGDAREAGPLRASGTSRLPRALSRGRGRRLSSQEVRARALRALDMTGTRDLAGRMVGELSGGQLQRVMLARALVNAPRLLVLDEPTTGLDEASAAAFYRTVCAQRDELGVAVLLVTHDLVHVPHLGARVLRLEGGVLAPQASEGACALGDAAPATTDPRDEG